MLLVLCAAVSRFVPCGDVTIGLLLAFARETGVVLPWCLGTSSEARDPFLSLVLALALLLLAAWSMLKFVVVVMRS